MMVSCQSGRDDFVNYALIRLAKRFECLERSSGASVDEVNRVARETEDT